MGSEMCIRDSLKGNTVPSKASHDDSDPDRGYKHSNETRTEDNPHFLTWTSKDPRQERRRADPPPVHLEPRPRTGIENHRGKKGSEFTLSYFRSKEDLQGNTIPSKPSHDDSDSDRGHDANPRTRPERKTTFIFGLDLERTKTRERKARPRHSHTNIPRNVRKECIGTIRCEPTEEPTEDNHCYESRPTSPEEEGGRGFTEARVQVNSHSRKELVPAPPRRHQQLHLPERQLRSANR